MLGRGVGDRRYFFSAMARDAVSRHKPVVDTRMKTTHGSNWWTELQERTDAYQESVDALIRDRAETGEALARLDGALSRIPRWRRAMESHALRAPQERQRSLLKAAGYGLGSPRSVKEAKDFLAKIAPLVELHADELKDLGASPPLLAVPAELLEDLEQGATVVAREKAEDSVARDRLQDQKRVLAEMWRAVSLVVDGELAEAELFADEERRKKARELSFALEAALGQARVQARKRAEKGDVPPELVVEEEAAPEPVAEEVPGWGQLPHPALRGAADREVDVSTQAAASSVHRGGVRRAR